MQTKLEQTFKEYTELKNYIQEDSKNIEQLKKQAHNEAIELETLDEQAAYFFDKIGVKDVLRIDFLELQKKLYYTYEAYKDLIEVSPEIIEELKDYKIKSVFAIVGGKKEIIDKDLYSSYKEQHKQYARDLANYQKVIEGTN